MPFQNSFLLLLQWNSIFFVTVHLFIFYFLCTVLWCVFGKITIIIIISITTFFISQHPNWPSSSSIAIIIIIMFLKQHHNHDHHPIIIIHNDKHHCHCQNHCQSSSLSPLSSKPSPTIITSFIITTVIRRSYIFSSGWGVRSIIKVSGKRKLAAVETRCNWTQTQPSRRQHWGCFSLVLPFPSATYYIFLINLLSFEVVERYLAVFCLCWNTVA